MKTIGVAFGGGGARGLAHVGVLRALRRDPRYLPSMVAGTSAGAIVAALYGCGLPQEEIEQAARAFHWFRHVINFSDTVRERVRGERGGLVSNAVLGDTINTLIGGRGFDDLDIDLAIVASDIRNQRRVISTSHRVAWRIDHRELHRFLPPAAASKPGCETKVICGFPDIGTAVRASCAVPGIFLPVEIEGMCLVDGGVVDQVPVDVVRARGATEVIGVSLSLAFMPRSVNTAASTVAAMIATLGIHQHRRSLDLADIGFQLSGIDKRSVFNPRQYDSIDQGDREMSHWLELRESRRRRLSSILRRPRQPRGLPVLGGTAMMDRKAESAGSRPPPRARPESSGRSQTAPRSLSLRLSTRIRGWRPKSA